MGVGSKPTPFSFPGADLTTWPLASFRKVKALGAVVHPLAY